MISKKMTVMAVAATLAVALFALPAAAHGSGHGHDHDKHGEHAGHIKGVQDTVTEPGTGTGAHIHNPGTHEAHAPMHKHMDERLHYINGVHNPEYDVRALWGDNAESILHSKSPHELEELIEWLFHNMDKNKDDQVNEEEIADWIISQHEKMKEVTRREGRRKVIKSVKREVRELDTNRDGFVSFMEYWRAWYGGWSDDDPPPDADEETLAHEKRMRLEEQKHFMEEDSDGDGKLNLQEFMIMMHPELDEKATRRKRMKEIAEWMYDKDLDKDGLYTWEEHWNRFKDRHWGTEEMHQRVIREEKELLMQWDMDGDGQLSMVELEPMLFPDEEKFGHGEAAHLLELCDFDDSGFMTLAEMKEHKEAFIGGVDNIINEHDEL
eukprot:PLAT1221.1.p2 GENE.PLAT1221.1~~PLAT1221.1.p2  ORF type:complete len:393 (-),score=224.87 PLAT1221.1:194-1333(-)